MRAAAAATLLQSCLTLCDPTDGSPLGSSVAGILQARTLEWVAISRPASKERLQFFLLPRNWQQCHFPVRRSQWHPTPVFLPGECQGRWSLVGCSPWGCEESDTTERLHFHFALSCIGEGNGNPLQCSCLENPRDRGAWWAAPCGVAQSDTTEVT